MTKRTSFLTRCLSMLLVLAMLLSNVNMGFAMRASAAEVKVGEVLASNYALDENLTALVTSGYLMGTDQPVTYEAFVGKDLVTVENGTITAKAEGEWKPVSAKLVKDGQVLAETGLTDAGNGTYTGTYNTAETMFSVEVMYALDADLYVNADQLQRILDTGANLNASVKYVAAMHNSLDVAALSSIATALPFLKQVLEKGYNLDSAEAIKTLNAELVDGMLPLQNTRAGYAQHTGSKVGYLVSNGENYRSQFVATYSGLAAIAADPDVMSDNFPLIAQTFTGSETAADAVSDLQSKLAAQVDAMKLVAESQPNGWNVHALWENLAEENYLAIDTWVAGQEPLGVAVTSQVARIATATATATMNMKLVNLTVKMTVIADNAETALTDYTAVLALPNETAAADVLAVINENVDAAIAGWGMGDVLGHYNRSAVTLPDALTEDISVEVALTPKNYTVTQTGVNAGESAYPYGYVVKLPVCQTEGKAYRYFISVDGGEAVKYGEGAPYTVIGNTTIKCEEVKAYEDFTLFQVIEAQEDNELVTDILSGLKGNKSYHVQMPDPTNDADLVALEGGKLTAKTFDADYEGWVWIPYSWGATGTENLFNGKTEADCDAKITNVIYRLELKDCSAEDYLNILKTVENVKKEAENQLSSITRLNGYYADLGNITPTVLDVLISNVKRTDFTKVSGADDAAMEAHFNTVLNGIYTNCMNTAGSRLALRDLLDGINSYLSPAEGEANKADALNEYYTKDTKIIAAVTTLSEYLNQMLPDEGYDMYLACLGEIVNTAKQDDLLKDKIPEGIEEKLGNLKTGMNEVKAGLTVKNAAIETLSSDLLNALVSSETYTAPEAGMVPYKETLKFPAYSNDYAVVTIEIWKNGEKIGAESSDPVEMGKEALTEANINAVKDAADAVVAEKFAGILGFYNPTYGVLPEVGTILNGNETVKYEFNAKPLTVQIVADGAVVSTQTITIDDEKTITLGSYPDASNTDEYYVYKIGNTSVTAEERVFTVNDVKTLFADSTTLTITRTVIDRIEASIEDAFNGCSTITPVRDANGKTIALDVTIDYSKGENLMTFAQQLLMNTQGTSFEYIALKDKALAESRPDENGVARIEYSMQALVSAMLSDPNFGSELLIALAKNEQGLMLTTTTTLGRYVETNARSTVELKEYKSDIPMTITMVNGVEPALKKAASALTQLRPFMSFTGTNEGVAEIKLNVPEEAYGAYLAALVASNNLDKADMNTVNNEIALQFFQDYFLHFLQNDNVTAYTYANTLNRLLEQANKVKDTGYDPIDTTTDKFANFADYYYRLRNNVTFNLGDAADDYIVDMGVASEGVVEVMTLLGFDLSSYGINVKDEPVEAQAHVTVANLNKTYQAAVIDVNGAGMSNKFAYTENAAARVAEITGDAVVILTGDAGNLVFNHSAGDRVIKGQSVPHTVILDLNGMNVGSIANNGTGNLIIIDSNLDNTAAGNVGSVTGSNITILGGVYNGSVASHLKSGYAQFDGKTVSNALFHFEGSSAVDIVPHPSLFDPDQFGGKEDYVTTAMALAVDLGVDLVLKYYTSAMLSADGNDLLRVNFTDIVGLVTQETAADSVAAVVDEILGCINLDAEDGNPVGMAGGLDAFVNTVLAELLNVDKIYEVMYEGATPATWPIAVTEWKIETEHINGADDGYITVNLVPDATKKHTKNLTLNYAKTLALVPDDYKDNFQQVMTWLSETVINEVDSKNETFAKIDLNEIKREGKNIVVGGGLETAVALDFSHDVHPYKPGETVDPTFYNKMLATMLAYGSDTVEAELAKYTDADGKLRDLNKAMFDVLDKITVGTFFEGLEKACESDVTIQQMIDKVGFIELEAEYIEKMQSAYDKVKATVLKVITKYDLTSIAKQPMAKYNDGSYTYTFSADMKDHTLDAFYKGYGVIANLKESKATLKIILVDDYRIVFDTTDADENVIKSLGDLWINDQCVTGDLEGNTIWLKEGPTADFAVSYTYYDTTAMTTYEHMYVWKITVDPINSRLYHATRIEALDDVLKFNGASVWMGPDQVGLAFAYNAITEAQIKAFETELGYKIALVNEGYGTVLGSWNSDAIPVLDLTDGAHYRYRDTYSDINGVAYCGNHIRELTMDFVDKTINGRFFIRLEKIGAENADTVLYSGLVTRSMYYVADQNRNVTFGAPYDGYIDNILNYVEG